MRLSNFPLVIVALALVGCGGDAAEPPAAVTVSAASSLQDALQVVAAQYQEEHGEVEIRLNFAASGALQQQIERGAPVDLFLSAARRPMDELERKGLIDPRTRRDFTANELVLVVPHDAPESITGFTDLADARVKRVAIGEPASVPAGMYANELLHSLGIAEAVLPRTLRGQSVRQVLTYVERGEVEAGIVYHTDARASDRVRVVAVAPEGSHSPITYPLAVVSDAEQPAAALDFAEYLLGPAGQAVLARFGFRPVR